MFLDISPDFHSRDYSEETAREIDNEIRRIIEDSYKQVKDTLSERRNLLEQIAGILLEKEVIEGEELRRIVREYKEKDAPIGYGTSPGTDGQQSQSPATDGRKSRAREGAGERDKPKYRKEADRPH
jgi:hypothetical protein